MIIIKSSNIIKRLYSVFLCLILFIILAVPAYADSERDSSNAFYSLYSTVRAVSLPLAVIGVAGSALQLAYGNERAAEGAKRRIVIILCVTAAIYLVPMILGAGRDAFSSSAWDPSNPAG